MRKNVNAQQTEVIDLLDVWHSLTKHVKFIRKVTLITTGLALAYVFVVNPTYESSALLRVKAQKGISTSILEGMPMTANTQLLKTYQEIIKCRSVVEPVIARVMAPNKDGKYPSYESFVNVITTTPFKDTEMFKVSVKGSTPELAQATNNALIESFLVHLTELERHQYGLIRSFVEERLIAAKEDLYKAEDNLIKFQKSHTILNPEDAVKLVAEKFSVADKLKAENQLNLEAAQSRAGTITNGMSTGVIGFADNDVIRALNGEITKLETERVQLASKYTAKHPAMVKISDDIAGLQLKLNQAVKKAASVAQSNLDTIAKIQSQYGKDMAALSENQKEHVRLLRNVNVSQEIYYMLAKRLEESKVAEVSISRDVQIVDRGELPVRPVAPRKARTVILGFLVGLLASCGLVVFRDLMNRTIRTAEDVENYLGIPVLGQIPSVDELNKAEKEAELSWKDKIRRALWKK